MNEIPFAQDHATVRLAKETLRALILVQVAEGVCIDFEGPARCFAVRQGFTIVTEGSRPEVEVVFDRDEELVLLLPWHGRLTLAGRPQPADDPEPPTIVSQSFEIRICGYPLHISLSVRRDLEGNGESISSLCMVENLGSAITGG